GARPDELRPEPGHRRSARPGGDRRRRPRPPGGVRRARSVPGSVGAVARWLATSPAPSRLAEALLRARAVTRWSIANGRYPAASRFAAAVPPRWILDALTVSRHRVAQSGCRPKAPSL